MKSVASGEDFSQLWYSVLSMAPSRNQIGRITLILLGVSVATIAGWTAFVYLTDSLTDIVQVLLVLLTVVVGVVLVRKLALQLLPEYNVAEVSVEGPITRDGGSPLPPRPGGVAADDIVEQITRADESRHVEALLLKLNTPGGEVVPSDDIREAAMDFDGPTIAYATDTCASGGYWIASGCDEFWAREASIVGSIGVILSQVTAGDLLEKAGLTYEGIKSGEYKDALSPLKDLEQDEREYLQRISDNVYDQFVERVASGRDLSKETVRETEARIYLGEKAHTLGLVDKVGPREDLIEALEDSIGTSVTIEEFEPERGITERIQMGATKVSYAFGAGLANTLIDDGDLALEA